jgi:effector protein SdbA
MRRLPEKLLQPEKDSNYFVLVPKAHPWWYWPAWPFIMLAKTARNSLSIVLGRVLALAIFNPLFTINPEQDKQHFGNNPKYPDPAHHEDFEVINVSSQPNFFLNLVQNYARRLLNQFPNAPKFIERWGRQLLRFHIITSEDCDAFIGRVTRAAAGETPGKIDQPISPEHIYIKGTEFIEPELRAQTLAVINHSLGKALGNDTFNIQDNSKRLNFFSLKGLDGSILDSVEIAADGEAEKDLDKRTFVIMCMPRSNSYMAWLKRLRIYAEQAETTYVAFNYRGVERSRGVIWTEDDMVDDALAQAQRLMLMGVKPENIAFEGECLGAAIATMAAAEMHKQGNKVNLFNARSFRSTFDLALYKILPGKSASWLHPATYARYALAGLFIVFVAPIILLSRWNMNAEAAWKQIPDENKDFMVVRSQTSSDDEKPNVDDPMVEHKHASIYALEKETYKANYPQCDPEAKQALHRHRFTVDPEQRDPKKTNGHICARNQLLQRDPEDPEKPISGREYTVNFYRRIWHKDSPESNPTIWQSTVETAANPLLAQDQEISKTMPSTP